MDEQKKKEYRIEVKKAKKLKKKNMTSEQLAIYKKGKHVAHRNGFLLWLAANSAIAGGAVLGGYYGYNYLVENHSPKVVDTLKKTLDTAGNYLYNYIYYKSSYALESGKSTVLAKSLEQILDKYDEIKQELDDAKEKADEAQNGANLNNRYNFNQRTLTDNEKENSAKFIVSLYGNGEAKKFDIQSFQWGNTFNLNVNTTNENGDHTFTLSLNSDDAILKQGQSVFGTDPVEFNGDLYKKFGVNGLKPAINLITDVIGDLQTSISAVGIDNYAVSIEEMTNFFQEEDCLDYLLDAGIDLGVDIDRIKDAIDGDNQNAESENNEEMVNQ